MFSDVPPETTVVVLVAGLTVIVVVVLPCVIVYTCAEVPLVESFTPALP